MSIFGICFILYFLKLSAFPGGRDVTRTFIGGVYSYIHVLPDEFHFKSNSNFSI